jgi:hypothetical protein
VWNENRNSIDELNTKESASLENAIRGVLEKRRSSRQNDRFGFEMLHWPRYLKPRSGHGLLVTPQRMLEDSP